MRKTDYWGVDFERRTTENRTEDQQHGNGRMLDRRGKNDKYKDGRILDKRITKYLTMKQPNVGQEQVTAGCSTVLQIRKYCAAE